MPTTDPVKRRKQNCENQKRWRQRQVDTLDRLTDALEQSESRTKQLETESVDLRDALRKARHDIQQLQAANENLKSQVRGQLKGKHSRLVDHEQAGAGGISSLSSAAPGRVVIWNQAVQAASIGMPSEGMLLLDISQTLIYRPRSSLTHLHRRLWLWTYQACDRD